MGDKRVRTIVATLNDDWKWNFMGEMTQNTPLPPTYHSIIRYRIAYQDRKSCRSLATANELFFLVVGSSNVAECRNVQLHNRAL